MRLLPVVDRELRGAARRRGTYWTRILAALLALIVSAVVLLLMGESPRELGRALFVSLSILAFAFSLLAGVLKTSDCVSEEKREGTLGLLFLTDLKGYDVVLGKLAANSLNAFYGLLAILPVLALALLMGGVSPAAFGRISLVLVNTLFFTLTAGLLVSTFSRHEWRAILTTLLLILVLGVGPTLVHYVLLEWFELRAFGEFETGKWLYMVSPGFGFVHVMISATGPPPGGGMPMEVFWMTLSAVHGLGWLFLGVTSLALPRVWQDKAVGPGRLRWRDRWQRWCYGGAHVRKAFRTRLLELNPIYWLAGRDRLKPAYVWGFLGVTVVLWIWGWLEHGREWYEESYVLTVFFLHSILKLWVAMTAGRCFLEDHRSGAMELWLTTPLPTRRVLQGELLAFHRQFAWPMLAVLMIDVIFVLWPGVADAIRSGQSFSGLWGAIRTELSGNSTGVVFFLSYMVMLVLDFYTLIWVGMWLSLTKRRAAQAVVGTIGRVLVLPWLVFFGLALLMVVLNRFFGVRFQFNDRIEEWGVLGVWFGIGLVNNLFFGGMAYYRLHERFRLVASQRFAPPTTRQTRSRSRFRKKPPEPDLEPAPFG